MPRKRLTDIAIQKLSPAPSGKRVEYSDTQEPGLVLRITDRGCKTFTLYYYLGEKHRRLTLGRFPDLSVAEARDMARLAKNEISKGYNPQNAPRLRSRSNDLTLRSLAQEFIELYAKRKNKTWKETQRILDRNIIPTLGNRPIGSITRIDINHTLDLLSHAPTTANRTFATIRKLFNWAIERGHLETSPVNGLKSPHKERSRDRVLEDSEIASIWTACNQIKYPFGPLTKLLILTAQRRSEVASMRWRDLDLNKRVWSLPREFTKSGRANQVPLTSLAVQVISEFQQQNHELLFPSARNPQIPLSGFGTAKRRLDQISGVSDWVIHDLRRTAASGMARNGVPVHVVEKILNHSSGTISGVAAVYNRYAYEPEKRAALEDWSKHVWSSVEKSHGENVVLYEVRS